MTGKGDCPTLSVSSSIIRSISSLIRLSWIILSMSISITFQQFHTQDRVAT